MERVLVTGAGGFIGHHLVKHLKAQGYWVRGVDVKRPEYEETSADEFEILDMRRRDNCLEATRGVDHVYALAADMGGMGFISANHTQILVNNAQINLHTLEAAQINGVSRLFYSSSACIYPDYRQTDADVTALKESDAYPADPQDAYGWEKLMTEKLCEYMSLEHDLVTRVARFHNIYGPLGTWDGGREKAPAAMCRKVAQTDGGGEMEMWGDGEQTRSFCYIDDCVTGIYKLMMSDVDVPINLGSDRLISINDLAKMVIDISGKKGVSIKHIPGPQGVRGRNSDNTMIKARLGWEPSITLEQGMSETYEWVVKQIAARDAAR
jgi:GDP-D-mannose 3',5'-epimerase